MKKHGKALLTILLAALLLGACSPTALAEEALSEPSETVEEPAPAEEGANAVTAPAAEESAGAYSPHSEGSDDEPVG